jgi:hypothetical protein
MLAGVTDGLAVEQSGDDRQRLLRPLELLAGRRPLERVRQLAAID